MIDNRYLKRWVKSELALNAMINIIGKNGKPVVSLNYNERAFSNSPGFMPHNNSLNLDVDVSNNMNVLFMAHLPNSNEQKFGEILQKSQ
jgi:CTP-dependent riboflavin kinase